MCGRYTVLTEDEIIEIREILKDISLHIVKDELLEYNAVPGEIYPTDFAPVITQNPDGIAFESAKWGFKKWSGSGVIINARAETMYNKSSFSRPLEAGRCVVPAGEFFEWERLSSGKKKYYAKDRDGNILFMAGLYRDTKDMNNPNKTIREFVVVTKEATGEISRIHDRMPVILRVNQIEAWLTGKITPQDIVNIDFDIAIAPCEDENGEQLRLI